MATLTLGQIRSQVLDRLDNNSVLYTTAQLNAIINEFIQIVNNFTGMNQTSVSVPGFSVANQLIYPVPSPILFPLQCFYEGSLLEKNSIQSLARNNPQWARDTTTKLGPVARWAPIGISYFVIHPIDAIGGNDISIKGVIQTNPMVNDLDIVQIEDEYLGMAVDYVMHRIQMKLGGKAFSDSSMMLQSFYRGLKDRIMFQSMKFPRYWALTGESR